MNEVEGITLSVNTYRLKYNALPGDDPNATSRWGALPDCPNPQNVYTTKNTLTCDGDNNGIIALNSNTLYESTSFWKHLSNAQILSYNVTGSGYYGIQSAMQCNSSSTNVPTSALGANSCYNIVGNNDYGFGSVTFGTAPSSQSWLLLGGQVGNTFSFLPVISTAEMQQLDIKYDDGKPGTGRLQSFAGGTTGGGSDPNCATSAISSTAAYNTSLSGIHCTLLFDPKF